MPSADAEQREGKREKCSNLTPLVLPYWLPWLASVASIMTAPAAMRNNFVTVPCALRFMPRILNEHSKAARLVHTSHGVGALDGVLGLLAAFHV
ncbi:hypothetical protein [Cupriavidus sp. UME77]|uniref:hypothetical protein n=1 Tax=Cupriavidus sp. UME77 TaxID=1862321 RepID=UPI001602CAEF|nr:hypothetical protein [Cupriavidus sp. UME77]